MNEQIKIFENPQFGKIRTSGTPDEPLFCLADVCKVLDLQPSRVKDRLSCGVISSNPIVDSLGRQQFATFINEDGLYDVILDSRKPEAKAFRKWVTSEILPSIRKHGGYIATTPDDTPELIMARALKIADATIRKHEQELAAAREQLSIAEHTVEKQNQQLTEQKPKVEFYDAVTKSDDTLSVEYAAKIINKKVIGVPNFGRNKLFSILRETEILFGKGRNIRPYQKYIDSGYFKLLEYAYEDKRGVGRVGVMIRVTQKGLAYIIKTIKKYYNDKRESEQQNKPIQLHLGI